LRQAGGIRSTARGVHSADGVFYGSRMKLRCTLKIALVALVLAANAACGSRANRSETAHVTSQRSTPPTSETQPSDVAEPAEANPAPQQTAAVSTTTSPTGTCDMRVLADEDVVAVIRSCESPNDELVDPAATLARQQRVRVRGSLSKEVIRRIIRRHDKEMRLCFEAVPPEERPTALVTMHFRINPDGHVTDIKLLLNASPSSELPCCVANALRTWTFPPPDGGGVVLVTAPFTTH
jgi:outer membrane biosynthesis protein TonB